MLLIARYLGLTQVSSTFSDEKTLEIDAVVAVIKLVSDRKYALSAKKS